MGLLRADLQACANHLRRGDGQGAAARLLPPLLLGGMYWLLGSMLIAHPELLDLLYRGGDPLRLLFATALSPCPVIAGWIGFAHAQRHLFEAPELALWQSAPLRPGRAAWQVLLRSGALALLWAAALALPFALQLLHAGHAPAAAYLVLPLALVAAVLPSLCLVLALQIALLRLATGRWARVLLAWAAALAAFGFPVFLLVQMFAGSPAQVAELAAAAGRGQRPSPLIARATELLADASTGPLPFAALLPCLWVVAGGLLLFGLAAPLHGVAVQHHQLAYRTRRLRLRGWPAGPVASIRRKEFAHLLQQPGSLLHMLLVGATVYVLAGQRLLVHEILTSRALPEPARQCGAMLFLWFLGVLMLLYAHMGRLAAWDGAQWPLYQCAPVRPLTLLAGKLQAVGLFLLWPVLVAALAGVRWFGAGAATVLAFAGFAVAGNLVALAAIAVVGTWPGFVRREPDGRLTQGSRGLAASLVLVLAFYLAVSPAFLAWMKLADAARRQPPAAPPDLGALLPGALLAAWLFGLLLAAAGALFARANYRRLLAPR